MEYVKPVITDEEVEIEDIVWNYKYNINILGR